MKEQELSAELEQYLDTQNHHKSNHRVLAVEEVNMGWETELFMVRVGFHDGGLAGEENLVLRVFSGDGDSGKASKEFYLMKRLEEVGYPVPPVYYLEASGEVIGKPFILMRRIMGKTLDATFKDDDQSMMIGLARMIELFIELHRLDSSMFTDIPHLPAADMDYFLGYYREVRDKYASWMTPLVDWIVEHAEEVSFGQSLCHMDYHGMNVMLENDQPFVIDWGAATLCDHRFDLAWSLLLYSTFGSPQGYRWLIEQYECVSGEKIEHIEFFEVAAAARRIADVVKTIGGGSAGLRPDILNLMRQQKRHFIRVHDFLEERTGFRLKEFDMLLSSL